MRFGRSANLGAEEFRTYVDRERVNAIGCPNTPKNISKITGKMSSKFNEEKSTQSQQ